MIAIRTTSVVKRLLWWYFQAVVADEVVHHFQAAEEVFLLERLASVLLRIEFDFSRNLSLVHTFHPKQCEKYQAILSIEICKQPGVV